MRTILHKQAPVPATVCKLGSALAVHDAHRRSRECLLYASTKRIAMLLALILTATGCSWNNSRTPSARYGHSIFDDLLAKESIQVRVKEVEQDLPGDVMKAIGEGGLRPQRWNDTREGREKGLAQELLRELQPALRSMRAAELVAAMKLYPMYSNEGPRGVAYWLCGEGNQMIIDELRSRSAGELKPLNGLVRDKTSEVFLNESYSENLGILCREMLREKGVMVPDA